MSLELFEGSGGLIGLPDRPWSTFTRGGGFASASPASRQAVVDAVEAVGVEVYGRLEHAPMIFVRMSDAVLLEGVSALMGHENVDYLSANIPHEGVFDLQ